MKTIEFISYTGKWPCLCHGVLTVKIDGVEKTFGYNCDYEKFWCSGGTCGFTDNYSNSYVDTAPWELSCSKELEEIFTQEELEELLEVFNENVEWGCCGGCL